MKGFKLFSTIFLPKFFMLQLASNRLTGLTPFNENFKYYM